MAIYIVGTPEAPPQGGGASFVATHYVDGAAGGAGVGTISNPFTMAQAVALYQPGWKVQLNTGSIAGPATGDPFTPSFSLNRAGTADNPCIWFAQNYAALSEANRTTFTHPGGSPNGNPIIGLSAPYNQLYGIYVDERNAIPGKDTGTIVITAAHVVFRYFDLNRGNAQWPAAAVDTNLSGIRIEPNESNVFDVVIADGRFRNYTAGSGGYGETGSLLFSKPGYEVYGVTYEHCVFDDVTTGVYIKGAGIIRSVSGAMTFRKNLFRINTNASSVNIYPLNLSDIGDARGRNRVYQNIAIGGRTFVRSHFQSDQGGRMDLRSLDICNNTVIDLVANNDGAFLRDVFQGNQAQSTWRIHNNIYRGTARMYNFPFNGGDNSVLSRNHNTGFGLSESWSSIPGVPNESITQLPLRRAGHDANSNIRNPLFTSTTWGATDFGKLQAGSLERLSGVDIMNLQGLGTSAPINRGAFILADMSDAFGIRPLT